MWNTVLGINSVLCALACLYTTFSIGASIYFLSWHPLELGVLTVFVLIVVEVILGALDS
jgi:hypothetical protein